MQADQQEWRVFTLSFLLVVQCLVPLPAFSHRGVYFVEDINQLSDNHTPRWIKEGETEQLKDQLLRYILNILWAADSVISHSLFHFYEILGIISHIANKYLRTWDFDFTQSVLIYCLHNSVSKNSVEAL